MPVANISVVPASVVGATSVYKIREYKMTMSFYLKWCHTMIMDGHSDISVADVSLA